MDHRLKFLNWNGLYFCFSLISSIHSLVRIHNSLPLFFTNNHIFYVNSTKKTKMYKITTIIDWYTENTHTLTYTNEPREKEKKLTDTIRDEPSEWCGKRSYDVDDDDHCAGLRLVNNFRLRFFGYTRRCMLYTHTHSSFSISLSLPVCWLDG